MANRTDTQSVINLVINGQQAMTTQRELTDAQRRLNSEMRNMRPNDPGYRERLREVQMVNVALREQRAEMQGIATEGSKFKEIFSGVFAGITAGNLATSALEAIPAVLGKIKDAYAEAEKNRAVLTNAFGGDAKIAGESLKMLMDYAAQTPFGMQEATDSYIKLVNRGIVPTRDEMVKLGDLAASQGKSLDQLVEGLLDAQTGEFERLKEFGIRASKNGDMVSLSFKGITKEVKYTEEAIKEAVLGFGAMNGVSGIMETVSKSIVGLESNIDDTWDQIFMKMGQSSEGLIHGVYSVYGQVLGFINESILATETVGQRLTKEFQNQATEVRNLEQSVNPLLSRYDDLKSKGKLNKDEQSELKNVINQLALSIPGAVTQWDKYGNALDINAGKAREFLNIQRAVLKTQNKETIEQLELELKSFTMKRDGLMNSLNSGKSIKAVGSDIVVKPMTDKEKLQIQQSLKDVNDMISQNQNAIKGLNGDYMVENNKKTDAEVKSSARTEAVIKKKIEDLKELRAQEDIHSKAYAKYTADIKKLEDELSGAKGKKSASEKSAEKAYKKQQADAEHLKAELIKNAEDLYLESLDLDAKEIEAIDRKYEKLEEKAKGNAQALKDIEWQKEIELSALYQVQTQRAVDIAEEKGKKITEQYLKDANAYYDATTSDHQKEIDKLNTEYDEKLRLYEMFGGDMEALAREYYGRVSAIEAGEDSKKGKKGKKKLTKEEELQAYSKAAIDAAYVVADTTFQIGANKRQAETDAKLSTLEKQRQAELDAAEGNEASKAEINARYAEMEKQEKLRAWEANRKAAITQALINGALAATNIWATTPKADFGVSTYIMLGLSAAATIGSIASIASQEPPQFAKGVRNFQGGTALVGEAGREIINEEDKWWLTDGPTYANLAPGADVYNAAETSRILADRMYQKTSYTLNTTGARNAEMSYRNNTNSTSTSKAGTNASTSSAKGNDMDELKGMLAETLNAIYSESQKPVVLDYNTKANYEKKMNYAVNSQKA
ncbi:hypothetical protein OQZ33_04480 [Pedobacter sp. MC2016-05]|uniref:hypothetical protein n=1 Tax=Pedobacter sp. MC2016-05 TaxID=2994474 RepID=UPI002248205C|nr:hypothetical protein [Pedobacter sp. MC2016-05]MCX2473583.1 hypothetical protein [Pedobacter sp. MC2016-05]